MTKIVLRNGLIAGAIITAMMIITVAICYQSQNFEGNMFLGYATMLLAFSLIFFGIKNYRDGYHAGIISFGKAFKVGLYITLVASTLYVVVRLIAHYAFFPDFMEKYSTQTLNQVKASGATEAEINSKVAEMSRFKELYKDPLWVVLLTYAEILPMGLLVTLLSALFLKRKEQKQLQPA